LACGVSPAQHETFISCNIQRQKIVGPTYENGFWRIKTNQELEKIIEHKNTINFATAQRIQETRMVKAIHYWRPISKRPTGRPKTRWEDDIKKDTQKLTLWRQNFLLNFSTPCI
jgi:hypothetical protein